MFVIYYRKDAQCDKNGWWLSQNDRAGEALTWNARETEGNGKSQDLGAQEVHDVGGHDWGRSGSCVKHVVFAILLDQLSHEVGSPEQECEFHSCTIHVGRSIGFNVSHFSGLRRHDDADLIFLGLEPNMVSAPHITRQLREQWCATVSVEKQRETETVSRGGGEGGNWCLRRHLPRTPVRLRTTLLIQNFSTTRTDILRILKTIHTKHTR